jgi:hypothetical protein
MYLYGSGKGPVKRSCEHDIFRIILYSMLGIPSLAERITALQGDQGSKKLVVQSRHSLLHRNRNYFFMHFFKYSPYWQRNKLQVQAMTFPRCTLYLALFSVR